MQSLRVHSITYGAEGVLLFELTSPDGAKLPPFAPGAHIRINMGAGLVRSYSLMNSPDERSRYVIGVQLDRNSRGGSRWMHESVRTGQFLEIDGPYNAFSLNESAKHSIFIAGGIGVTPFWSMILRLQSLGSSWNLYYRTRTAGEALFPAGVGYRDLLGNVQTSFADRMGRESFDIERMVREAPAAADLYCCGPPLMIECFLQAAASRPAAQVHVEYFQAQEPVATDGGYTVRLVRSDRSIEMAKGQSILSAVLALGIDAPYSCQEGLCGECETKVISGIPDHRDLFLTQTEKKAGDKIMICCSGSLTPLLELDL
jgi:vanillate O-demethylase ferredoxin subunit